MHALLLLTVLSSLNPTLEVPMPARLEAGAFLSPPASERRTLHLLEPRPYEEDENDGVALRVTLEYLTGLVTGAVAMTPSLLIDSSNPQWVVAPFLLNVLGSSAGVAFTGWMLDRRANFGDALTGGAIGFVAPAIIGLGLMLADSDCTLSTTSSSTCDVVVPAVIGALLLPAIGAVVSYELSEPTPWLSLGHASSTPPSAPRVVPVVGPAPQGLGLTVGIAGRL